MDLPLFAKSLADPRPLAVYLAMQADSGRRSQASALARIAAMMGQSIFAMNWAEMRYEHLTALKARMQEEGLRPATINRHLSAVRGVAREAWRLRLLDTDAYTRLCDVANLPNRVLPQGRALSRAELCAVQGAMEGPRLRALFWALLCGLRRAEIVHLRPEDVRANGLFVRGKGKRERLVPYVAGSRESIETWAAHPSCNPSCLFSITEDGVYKVLLKAAERAGIRRFSPHDFRRTFCTSALDAGIGIDLVAHAAGHASVNTTRRYDRSKDNRANVAIGGLSLL